MLHYSTMSTPTGDFTIVVSESGAVRAAGFTTDVQELISLVHPTLRAPVEPADDVGAPQAAVRSYLDGDLAAIDAVPVEQRIGGDFITHAWKVMRDIPAGAPVTYTQFAELAGRPAAVRGAASACARNPVALFVPCHRVLRTDGGLGGYRWGLPVKSWLLAHEKGRSIGA
jgi:methylated-DNA-[protein]-cysteine S-methyltransferase